VALEMYVYVGIGRQSVHIVPFDQDLHGLGEKTTE